MAVLNAALLMLQALKKQYGDVLARKMQQQYFKWKPSVYWMRNTANFWHTKLLNTTKLTATSNGSMQQGFLQQT